MVWLAIILSLMSALTLAEPDQEGELGSREILVYPVSPTDLIYGGPVEDEEGFRKIWEGYAHGGRTVEPRPPEPKDGTNVRSVGIFSCGQKAGILLQFIPDEPRAVIPLSLEALKTSRKKACGQYHSKWVQLSGKLRLNPERIVVTHIELREHQPPRP